MKAVAVLGVLVWTVAAPAAAAIKTAPFGCGSFIQDLPTAVAGYRASFERPLTITRGFGGEESGLEIRTLSTNTEVEGTLKCRGDQFVRFEMRILAPAKDKTLADFDGFARAALIAAFRWDQAKAEAVVHALDSDASEYLRASEQRGDLYVSGKVEYHQGDKLDLGLIWTLTDHTFVLSAQTDQ